MQLQRFKGVLLTFHIDTFIQLFNFMSFAQNFKGYHWIHGMKNGQIFNVFLLAYIGIVRIGISIMRICFNMNRYNDLRAISEIRRCHDATFILRGLLF